jgi:selenocysteine-specific elongation factor
MEFLRSMIIGTAGHIDHGKTSLVRALTGVDTDRLKEEKARGISIELGYAYTALADGEVLGFVDVPGHERLVHTMVAGVGGIDYALLVIAADDGVMPQTREHLAILQLLGINRGAVALSKIDRVDAARIAAVQAQIGALLAPTALSHAPLFPVAATAVDDPGVAELRAHFIRSPPVGRGTPRAVYFAWRSIASSRCRDAARSRPVQPVQAGYRSEIHSP